MQMSELENMQWLNPPPRHTCKAGVLTVVTGNETDFWRETFYGFWRSNGHFFHRAVAGDFTAEVTVNGAFETLYDQAGLMIRLGETHWVKAGIEFTDGQIFFSVVVTNDRSDWSLVPVRVDADGLRIRLTRHGNALRVQFFDADDNAWKSARLAFFPASETADVGLMCCSPQRQGLEVAFSDFTIGPPISRELHD